MPSDNLHFGQTHLQLCVAIVEQHHGSRRLLEKLIHRRHYYGYKNCELAATWVIEQRIPGEGGFDLQINAQDDYGCTALMNGAVKYMSGNTVFLIRVALVDRICIMPYVEHIMEVFTTFFCRPK